MKFLSTLWLLALSQIAWAGGPLDWVADHPGTIHYSLDLERIEEHLLDIRIDFPAVPTGTFELRMSAASPGRYAQHNFAKNIHNLRAYDENGSELILDQKEVNVWLVAGHRGQIRVEYSLFANGPDGTYAGIDDRKLHLNMPAVFLYGTELPDRPVLLTIPTDQRPDWTVATQLVDLGDRRFAAPDYAYFYDSPTLMGDLDWRRWELSGQHSQPVTMELAVMHEGSPEDVDRYLEWAKAVVEEQRKVYGELPDFDYDRYTFLCTYNPWVKGDGMEHRNSTICSSSLSLSDDAHRLIRTLSHEFFHAWNVERLRPAHLEPFELAHPNMSDELWFAEGFTSYYQDLMLVRAGIIDPATYAERLSDQLNYVLPGPGRQYRNPIEMSRMAPFVDAATSVDPTHFHNSFISYYSYGAVLGLCLDLQLRQRETNLDQLMRRLWLDYGRHEIPYHVQDVQQALATVSGSANWAEQWFERHIYGSELPDLKVLLHQFGIRWTSPETLTDQLEQIRVSDLDNQEGVRINSLISEKSILYASGLQRGDILTSLNDTPIRNTEDWKAQIENLQAGRSYPLGYLHLGQSKQTTLRPEVQFNVLLEAMENLRPEQMQLRKDWLGE